MSKQVVDDGKIEHHRRSQQAFGEDRRSVQAKLQQRLRVRPVCRQIIGEVANELQRLVIALSFNERAKQRVPHQIGVLFIQLQKLLSVRNGLVRVAGLEQRPRESGSRDQI